MAGEALVLCPDCGNLLSVSIDGIDAQGLPYCIHDHGTITWNPPDLYPTWTRMMRVAIPPKREARNEP